MKKFVHTLYTKCVLLNYIYDFIVIPNYALQIIVK